MVGTGVVALAIATARTAAPSGMQAESEFLIEVVIVALVAALISLLTIPPTMAATLRPGKVWLTISVLLVADAGIVVSFIVVVALTARPPPPTKLLIFFLFIPGTYIACLTGVLLAAQRLGYRLIWGR
jgi:hypothetical protein